LLRKTPGSKNGTDAIALGRQGGRLFPFPRVFAEQKLRKAKNGTEARQDVGASNFLGVLRAKPPAQKMAWMPFFEQRKG
jgi:hypothetical protein